MTLLNRIVDFINPLPIPLEDRDHPCKNALQQSLSAYFSIHSLSPDLKIPKGLTIPWVEEPKKNTHGDEINSLKTGFLVATGELSEEKKWPIFRAVTINGSTDYSATCGHSLIALNPLL